MNGQHRADPVTWRQAYLYVFGFFALFALFAFLTHNIWTGPIVVAVVAAYWAPTLIARQRHVPNVGQVAIVNGLLGWMFIGWVIALIMAAKPTDTAL